MGLSGCWGFRVPARPKNGLRGFKALRSALCRLSLLRAGGDSDFAVQTRMGVAGACMLGSRIPGISGFSFGFCACGRSRNAVSQDSLALPLGRRFGSGSEALMFRALE